jgi:hypothetical protein
LQFELQAGHGGNRRRCRTAALRAKALPWRNCLTTCAAKHTCLLEETDLSLLRNGSAQGSKQAATKLLPWLASRFRTCEAAQGYELLFWNGRKTLAGSGSDLETQTMLDNAGRIWVLTQFMCARILCS